MLFVIGDTHVRALTSHRQRRKAPSLDDVVGARYSSIVRVLNWNGKTMPRELRDLPPGRYVVESVDLVPELTQDEEAGLESAIASLRRGEGIDARKVHEDARSHLRGSRKRPKR